MFKSKNINDYIPTALVSIIFSALCFTIYGCVMFYKSLLPFHNFENESISNENFTEKIEIYDNVYLEQINTFNAANGNKMHYEINLFNYGGFNYANEQFGKKFNLNENNKGRYILLFFSGYYLILTLAWLLAFYHLFMFVMSQHIELTFYSRNSKRLQFTSKIIWGIAFFKFFGISLFSTILIKLFDTYFPLLNNSYEFFTGLISLFLIAQLLKVIALAYSKGNQIETDQELTI